MVAAQGGDEVPYEIIRFPYDGTIDADGHVLEPAWLWEEYLEAAHLWATDYPHPDHPPGWARALERFVAGLGTATRAKLLGENVRRRYGIG
jgi:predicted TIM-barrel fold metal-dependent hydrolase